MPPDLCQGASPLSVTGSQVGGQIAGRRKPRENIRPVFRDSNSVLDMRTGLAIKRYYRPTIGKHLGVVASHIKHRLNRKNVANLDLWPKPRLTVIRYLGVLVHSPPNPMTNIVAHN